MNLEQIEAEIEAYQERLAIQTVDDGLTTTERAVHALKRKERFRGEHEVARAWIRNYSPEVRVFCRSRPDE